MAVPGGMYVSPWGMRLSASSSSVRLPTKEAFSACGAACRTGPPVSCAGLVQSNMTAVQKTKEMIFCRL